jgi:hypothetical protein
LNHPRNVVWLLILLAVLAAGAAAYKIASSEGVDPGAAGVEATRAGERRGEAAARREAFKQGFERGRDAAYESAYREAYLAAYRDQFERAGLAPPAQVEVRGP